MALLSYPIDEILDPHFREPKDGFGFKYSIRARKSDGRVWGYVAGAAQQSFGKADDPGAWKRAEEWKAWGDRHG